MKDLLMKLSLEAGTPGDEDAVAEVITNELRDCVDWIGKDNLGNLICHKKGAGKKVMLAAHMDEIGLMVTSIDENGFLRFTNVGGHTPVILAGTRVQFNKDVSGVISFEHIDDIKELKFGKMYIDIGAKNKTEALTKVSVGSVATFLSQSQVQGSRFIGKALDDRVGCAVLINVLKEVKNSPYNIFGVFTVQEEVGLRGARTAAYKIDPDIAFAIDLTLTGDTPGALNMSVKLGEGVAIKIMDRSIICHPSIKNALIEIAEKNTIPYQLEVLDRGGTDAGSIHISRGGIPTGALSIPGRYVHTANEMIDMDDAQNAINLFVKILQSAILEDI